MSWRDGARRGREQAEARMGRIIENWQPAGAMPDSDDELPGSRHVILGPWSRPAVKALGLIVLALAGVVGYVTWQSQPVEFVPAPEVMASGAPITGMVEEATLAPPVEPPSGAAEPSSPVEPAEVVVHVTGWVANPGLVRLPPGSRVADAIDEAGGLTRPRAADYVNLARVVVDGEQITVSPEATSATVNNSGTTPAPAVLDLNTATAEQLDALPGVGPVLAGRIITWRTAHGRFSSVDELGEVSGIGDAILGQLRPMVRV